MSEDTSGQKKEVPEIEKEKLDQSLGNCEVPEVVEEYKAPPRKSSFLRVNSPVQHRKRSVSFMPAQEVTIIQETETQLAEDQNDAPEEDAEEEMARLGDAFEAPEAGKVLATPRPPTPPGVSHKKADITLE